MMRQTANLCHILQKVLELSFPCPWYGKSPLGQAPQRSSGVTIPGIVQNIKGQHFVLWFGRHGGIWWYCRFFSSLNFLWSCDCMKYRLQVCLHPLSLLHPQLLLLLMWGLVVESVNLLYSFRLLSQAALILFVKKCSKNIQFSVNQTLGYSGNRKQFSKWHFWDKQSLSQAILLLRTACADAVSQDWV